MGNKDEIKKLSIEEQFYQLDEELAVAKNCYVIYRNLAMTTSDIAKSDMEKVGYRCPNFLQAEMIIVGRYLTVQVHKFFDNHFKSIQLIDVIDQCNDRDRIKQIYTSIDESHVYAVSNIRHKVAVHTDKNKTPECLYKEAEVSYLDILNVINKLEEIMHLLSESLNVTRIAYINEKLVRKEQTDMFRFAAKGINLI